MELTHKQMVNYLEIRRDNIISLKDLRDVNAGGFGVVDNLMKHAALFEVELMIKKLKDLEKL